MKKLTFLLTNNWKIVTAVAVAFVLGAVVSVVLAQTPSTLQSATEVTTIQPDGTVTKTKPDGTVETIAPDGTVKTIAPDGQITVTTPEGTIKTTTLDGTVTTTAPDGVVTVQAPDGVTTTTTPEGTVTTTRPPSSSPSSSPSPSSSGGNSTPSNSATFSVSVTGQVISFEGTATGDITVSLSGSMATYSRGGVSAPPLDIGQLASTRLASGQTLNLTATQVGGPSLALRFIDGPGNVIVRDLHLRPGVGFSNITNTGTKNATWNGNATATSGNYGGFTVSVASGSTLTQTASAFANATIVGEGNVSVTSLNLYPSLDLRRISNSGTKNAYWGGSTSENVAFTGHLGSFTTTVGDRAMMTISAEKASNKIILGTALAWVQIKGLRQAPGSNFSQIRPRVTIDSYYDPGGPGPSTFTGNLGSLRSFTQYTRFQGVVNGDRIAFVSSSGPQPDSLSVNENGQWHYDSFSDVITYCVDGTVYKLEIFEALAVTHSDNFFTISR